MDPASKKRKPDENGGGAASPPASLSPEDARKILEPFTEDQLIEIVTNAMCGGDGGVLDAVRSLADRDTTQRKLFIRGLGWDTTNDSLRAAFAPFGDIDEAVVIADKATGRSKGYGFVTFRHVDGAILALKEPSKKIDSRVAVTQLAAVGNTGAGGPVPAAPAPDVSLRKIYVGNVPEDMSSESMLAHFSTYGEIEAGPLGFDKNTGKFRGYTLFIYKTVEAAQAALVNPTKTIDGHHLLCKLANPDNKRGQPGVAGAPVGPGVGAPQGHPMFSGSTMNAGDGLGLGPQSSIPGSLAGQFGVPGQFGAPGAAVSSFGGYTSSGLASAGALSHHHSVNSPIQSSIGMGAPGLSSAAGQVPTSLGGSGLGGYGAGLGGPYGSSSQYPGPGSGGYSGLGMGSSQYRTPPASSAMPSGGYPESGHGHYSLSSSAYQSQHHQPAGSSPGRRYPAGGYPGMNPYY